MSRYSDQVQRGEELPAFTFPGGYPIVYFVDNDAVVCASCATKAPEEVFTSQAHMEGPAIDCSVCGEAIESAYGDPEDAEEEEEEEPGVFADLGEEEEDSGEN